MSQAFTVIWDGRRSGPGGSQLFTEEFQPSSGHVEARPRIRVAEVTVREAVTAFLQRGPMTQRELVAETGLGMERINSALYSLRQAGRVHVIAERPLPHAKYGRTAEYVYALTSQ